MGWQPNLGSHKDVRQIAASELGRALPDTTTATLKAAAPDSVVIELLCCHRRFVSALHKMEVLHAKVEAAAGERVNFDAPVVRVRSATCVISPL